MGDEEGMTSPNQLPPRRIDVNEDVLCEISSWCHSFGDAVALWSALCLRKRRIGITGAFWRRFLSPFFGAGEKDSFLRVCGIDESQAVTVGVLERLYKTRKCTRSGCFKLYRELDNSSSSCAHHHGRMRSSGGGSLSCCKSRDFKAPGCTRGYHNGATFEFIWAPREKSKKLEDEKKREKGNLLRLPAISISSKAVVPSSEGVAAASTATAMVMVTVTATVTASAAALATSSPSTSTTSPAATATTATKQQLPII